MCCFVGLRSRLSVRGRWRQFDILDVEAIFLIAFFLNSLKKIPPLQIFIASKDKRLSFNFLFAGLLIVRSKASPRRMFSILLFP